MKRKTARKPARRRPSYVQAVKAVNYWVIFDDLSAFFDQAGMPVVSQHLKGACQEIDRIWEESDYDTGQNHLC